MHIPKAKLPFYPPYEVKCRLQNGVSTVDWLGQRGLMRGLGWQRRGLGDERDESLTDERDESLMRELSLRVMMRESMVR